MFNLCMACWKSRKSSQFRYTSKGNISEVCVDCYESGRRNLAVEYRRLNEARPQEDRRKICNMCFEEKLRSEFYPKSGLPGKVGKDQRMSHCKECDIKHQKARKDPKAKSRYDRERYLSIREDKKMYDRWYNSLPRRVAANREAHYRRKSNINNQDNTLPSGFFEKALEYYGERCMRCESGALLTYDHIIPVSWGRVCDHSFLNLQILCRSCNSSKSDHASIDYRPMNMQILGVERQEHLDIFTML